jgi:ABC-type nickel/cobalt efflux system permease component RcnA
MPPGNRTLLCLICTWLLAVLPAPSPAAHPIEEKVYDRTITVRVTPAAVLVDYHLEVNARTTYSDVPDLVSKQELADITSSEQVYRAFLNGMEPLLGKTLYATLDDRELTFVCKEKRYRLLDHLRCEYRFAAAWKPAVGAKHRFVFREANFEDEKGAIRLSLASGAGVRLMADVQPDKSLWQRKPLDLEPRDQEKLRTASADFELTGADHKEEKPAPSIPRDEDEPAPQKQRSLEELILHSGLGFGALLFAVALWGTVHALTPGHGKTAAAAYLVGQRGTLWHALLLGVVTTLTHTGVVMVLALIFPWLFPKASLRSAHGVLMVVGGLLIAGVGFWLLLRRLAGQADHFHFGGHHHHHGHDHPHSHSHSHTHPDRPVTLGSLIVLGIGGGLVPCSDALAIFGVCVKWQRPELAFPLVVAFSAGLASVLVLIGLSVVYAQRFPLARWGDSPRLKRFLRLLPTLSALIVIALGLWMCYDGVHNSQR